MSHADAVHGTAYSRRLYGHRDTAQQKRLYVEKSSDSLPHTQCTLMHTQCTKLFARAHCELSKSLSTLGCLPSLCVRSMPDSVQAQMVQDQLYVHLRTAARLSCSSESQAPAAAAAPDEQQAGWLTCCSAVAGKVRQK